MTDLGLLPYNLTRARIRTRSNSNFIFLLSQVSHHLLTSRSFTRKQHVVFNKTTHHFQQNDTSFSTKQHVIFYKTTRYFSVQMKQNTRAKTAEP